MKSIYQYIGIIFENIFIIAKPTLSMFRHLKLNFFLFLLLCCGNTIVYAQPYISNDALPPFDIEARVRNGGTGFEGALFTPGTPAPGQPGGGPWQMNPAGAPIWNSNGNVYGDLHTFQFTFIKSTGTSTWNVDFNHDGDYADASESVFNQDSLLIGNAFKYVNIWGQGSATGFAATITALSVNGTNFSALTSNNNTPFSLLLRETSGLFGDITVNGTFFFSGGNSQEIPRIWIRLGTTFEAPFCILTSPLSGTVFNLSDTIYINAQAADVDDSVAVVEFYNDSILIGFDSIAPYEMTLLNVAGGPHTLLAKAFDYTGLFQFSSPVSIMMNVPPVCNLIYPIDSSLLFDPDNISLQAQANDPFGTITKVEFYIDSVKIGEDSIAPYNYPLINPALGIYSAYAIATDNNGLSTSSTLATYTVRCVREDLNNDGVVNNLDFLLFISSYNISCTGCPEDFSDDGIVNNVDFLLFLPKFNYSCN